MSVYEIVLTDPTQLEEPPERVLRVTAVAQMVFVSICTREDGNPTSSETVVEEMAVSLPGLRQALELLTEDGVREELRERDKYGLKPSIGGVHSGSVRL